MFKPSRLSVTKFIFITKINNGMDTDRKKKKRTPKKNVERGSTSSHGNKEPGTRSMDKQRGMEFGFRKTATVVMKPDIHR